MSRTEELTRAVQRYFDLMYDGDVAGFDRVFRASAQLHGFREGAMTVRPAREYREILARRQSPKALGAPRAEEIVLMDFASESQALVKVRVRTNATMFTDYLTWHRINGEWLITAKAYHGEPAEARA